MLADGGSRLPTGPVVAPFNEEAFALPERYLLFERASTSVASVEKGQQREAMEELARCYA